ncbi:Signal transduction histidine kinase [Arenibacter nanhaiticus]|uniref:histidine kinase n=1 Tax=Arenibacter nanhaiticus TaxID=558155 RepID=A0A1M6KDK4_9FLAO|nr:response regulator [Arenibacter nanhaiticus]SHJ56988.1 Signal transduction histidine kinase [Arenibacter nanhaiticus]
MSFKFSKKELLFPSAVFLVLMTIVIVLWQKSENAEKLHLQNEIRTAGFLRFQEFVSAGQINLVSLEDLKNRIEMTKGEYFQYWEEDAKLILRQNRSIKFIQWIDSSMVIQNVVPLEGNEAVLGFSLKDHPRKKEWEGHVQDGSINISSWLELVQGGNAFMVDVPVYFDEKFQGTITAGIDFSYSFDNLVNDMPMYAIEIKDENGTSFYKHNNPELERIKNDFVFTTTYSVDDLDGQEWSFSLMPVGVDPFEERKWNMLVFLVFGIVLSLLSSSLVYFYKRAKKENMRFRKAYQRLQELNTSLTNEQLIAKKASLAKSEFIANMSHEIRTPLNAILGFIEILKMSEIDAKLQEYLLLMDISSKKLLLLVDDILEIEKIESGKSTFKNDVFSPSEEVKSIVSIYKPSTEQKGLFLKIDGPINSNQFVHGDVGKFGQILTNLLRNALKFTEKGGITVSYHERKVPEGLAIEIVIKDTGIGIPKEKLHSIFDRFMQIDSGKAKRHEGGGLGLYISYQLISLFKGNINVSSTLGVGTEFVIDVTFPLAENKPKDTSMPSVITDFSGCKILIVDDNRINVIVLKKTLEKFGIQAASVSNGQRALELLQDDTFDLVFMDVHMPLMDGFEATVEIRKFNTDVIIIGFSADVTKEAIDRALGVGMNDYFTKPITFDKLRENLSRHLLKV